MEIGLFEEPEAEPNLNPQPKYFVGSLSFLTSSLGLSDYFSQWGPVLSANVIIDKMTGKSKGFGFVHMGKRIADLSQVNNTELDGRNIFVDEARSLPKVNDRKVEKYGHREFDRELRDVVENIEIGFSLVDDKIKVIELFQDKNIQLTDVEKNNYGLYHSLNPESKRLKESIQEFEYLINKPLLKENELQHFFKYNQDFILNENYKKAHSKIILQKEDQRKLIPDFILEPYDSIELCDLLELKLPSSKLYTMTKNRESYSASILKAKAQLREYAYFFEDPLNRKKIVDKYGLHMYHPNMIVVIGRSKNIDPMLLKRVSIDIPGLKVVTYDKILETMKRRKY
jgi:RNA recognition motif-containing protein